MRLNLIGLIAMVVGSAPPAAAQQEQLLALGANSDVNIRIFIPAGSLVVRGWDRDSIEVRAIPGKGDHFGGGGGRSAAKFFVEPSQRGDPALASATMTAFVPRGAKLWIKSTTARVDATGLDGEVDILQVTGTTTVKDVSGVVTVEPIDGQVDLESVRGLIRVRGGAGKLTMSRVGGHLDISMVGGSVGLDATPDDPPLSGSIETVGGAITVSGAFAAATRISLVSHDGPITLLLTGTPPARVVGDPPGAQVAGELRNPSPGGGVITVTSFKGKLNADAAGGI